MIKNLWANLSTARRDQNRQVEAFKEPTMNDSFESFGTSDSIDIHHPISVSNGDDEDGRCRTRSILSSKSDSFVRIDPWLTDTDSCV